MKTEGLFKFFSSKLYVATVYVGLHANVNEIMSLLSSPAFSANPDTRYRITWQLRVFVRCTCSLRIKFAITVSTSCSSGVTLFFAGDIMANFQGIRRQRGR